MRRRGLATLALLLAFSACDRKPAPGPLPAGAPGTPEAALKGTPTAGPAPAPARTGTSACEQGSLALAPDAVIATVDGKPLTVTDLGEGAIRAEGDALRTYCNEVARVRQEALDAAIDKRLLDKAATADGKPSIEAFLQSKVEAAGGAPTDAEIQAFYDKHKSPDAPPIEAVRQQVVDAIVDERTRTTIDGVLADLRKTTPVTTSLPDVRPPAFDLAPTDADPVKGDPAGVVTVTEFSDFECPYCSRAADTLKALGERYPQKVRFVFRHFPLSFHPNARPAAEHSVCAQEQGKFWPFHDLVFANQRALSVEKLGELAVEAGLDKAKLDECLGSGRARTKVDADYGKGMEVGVQGTPSFYINGYAFTGNPSPEGLSAAIDVELSRAGS